MLSRRCGKMADSRQAMPTAAPSPGWSSWEDFRLLLGSVREYAIFLLDPSGHVTSWNLGAERIKGYTFDEIVGKHFSTFYVPEDLAAGKPDWELRAALEHGRVEDEGWRLRKDGSRFWANVIITALFDSAGTLRGFGKVTRDLTEQRQAMEELRRSEERFRLLVDGVGEYAICMLDPDGSVSTWNVGAQNIFGYGIAEIAGRPYETFFDAEASAHGSPSSELSTARAEGRFSGETWRQRKDGSRFWAHVVLVGLRDASGAPIGFANVTRDLTARLQAQATAEDLAREQAARAAAEAAEIDIRQARARNDELNARLSVTLEAMGDAITTQDRAGRLIYANSAAARLCGFDSAEALMAAEPGAVADRFELFDEQGKAIPAERLPGRRVLAGESAASVIARVRERATGKLTWVSLRASPVSGMAGGAELAVNIWHEITEERRREEHERYLAKATTALSASLDYESMLSTLAGLLVPGLADWCTIDLLESGKLKSVAVAHHQPEKIAEARVFRESYPPEASENHGIWGVLHGGQPKLYSHVSDDIMKASARSSEHLAALRGSGMRSLLIVPIRLRNRVLGAISMVSTQEGRHYDAFDVVLSEELGRRAGVAIENAQLYAAERRAREQLEILAQAGQTLSGTLDYRETLQRVVRLALPMLGDFALLDVVEGTEVRRTAAAYDDPEVEALLSATHWVRSERTDKNVCALSSGKLGVHARIDEAWLRDVATSPEHLALLRRIKLCSLLTLPLEARGQILGSLTLCFGRSGRDYTDGDVRMAEELARRASTALQQARLYENAQTALEAAETANRVKDDFLATVSHELRTPLNAIVGWSSLLIGRPDDQSLEKGLDVIHRNALSQTKIIEDILDVSRIISGKLRLDIAPVDLQRVARDSLEVVRPSANAKRITLNSDIRPGQLVLEADPDRLQQVIWNLLSNAVKFTEPGGSVTLSMRRERSTLRIDATDTGRGIEPEFLPFVFDRFKQADGSTTRRVGGLGLGLAIVRHIVELHGGQVSVASEGLGKGATFSVVLPDRDGARPLEASPSAPAVREVVAHAPSLRGLRILLVDDDVDSLEVTGALLTQAGAAVQTSTSAKEAFDAVVRSPPHLVVSDIAMPDEDGHSLMRRIRALPSGAGGRLHAIALSAHTRTEDVRKSLVAGFDAHLTKPLNMAQLFETVLRLTAQRLD